MTLATPHDNAAQVQGDDSGKPRYLVKWGAFIAGLLVIYLGFYAWSENLVHQYGEKNRFYMIQSAPPQHYDFAILGASHAMPLGYDDMNERLEAAVGASVMNLSIEGGGVLPNRLLLDYFETRHSVGTVIYVLDSFVFYSRQWNEDRLDSGLLQRAPLDFSLARVMLERPWAWGEVLPYISGFSKINNHDRFAPDMSDAELDSFHRVYRPIPQIDRQRIAYLYPEEVDQAIFGQYRSEFEALIDHVRDSGGDVVVMAPPTPPRYRDELPHEAAFLSEMEALLEQRQVAFVDFSETVVEDEFYYDTDHLNHDGAARFIEDHLAPHLSSLDR